MASSVSYDYLDASESFARERIRTLEREYSDALAQAVTYRLLLLVTLASWHADHQRLVGAETRLRELLGATPWHPENDAD